MTALEVILKQCDKICNSDYEGWKVFENIRRELQQALEDTDGLIFLDTRKLNGINEEDDEIILKQTAGSSQLLPNCLEDNANILEHLNLNQTNTLPQQVIEPSGKETCKKRDRTLGEKTVNSFNEHEDIQINSDYKIDHNSRPKRGASSKASANINKQCSQKLNQKLRRPATNKDEPEEVVPQWKSSKERENNMKKSVEDNENKENIGIDLPVKIKQERISDNVPNCTGDSTQWTTSNSTIKPEHVDDFTKMPPPSRKIRQQGARPTDNLSDASSQEDAAETSIRRSRRAASRKDISVAQAGKRATRASSRNTTQDAEFLVPPAPVEYRPKRTRAKKQAVAEVSVQAVSNEVSKTMDEIDIDVPQIPIIEKPRPKRTRKGKQNTTNITSTKEQIEHEAQLPQEQNLLTLEAATKKSTDKLNPIVNRSPILPTKPIVKTNLRKSQSVEENIFSAKSDNESEISRKRSIDLSSSGQGSVEKRLKTLEKRETIVLPRRTASLERNKSLGQLQINGPQDKTMILPTNVCDSEDIFLSPENNKLNGDVQMTPPLNKKCLNETVVIEKHNTNIARDTVVIEKLNTNIARGTVVLSAKEPNKIMNETVTINNAAGSEDINTSLITNDSSSGAEHTPPKLLQYKVTEKPSSAVKERVQQFEEMNSNLQTNTTRVTRTKTRAMTKKDNDDVESLPSSTGKANALSASTLSKLIISGSHTKQQPTSAAKAVVRSNIVGSGIKSFLPASLTKPIIPRPLEDAPARRAADRDEALRKKEAMLEAQREERKKRRELKMAAAAAAREAAAKERQAAIEAQTRDKEKREQQLHADKMEKLKEMERKRQALEKRHQEMEERRRAEETARQARLEEEQRLAGEFRKKQFEEAERTRIEALNTEKQIQAARQKYLAKEKERKKLFLMKQRLETDKGHTPMKTSASGYQMPPVHRADGFEFLNSDDSDEPSIQRDYPDWTRSKARWHRLGLQVHIPPALLDQLFSVRAHTPDLRAIFPHVDRRVLKRTSSAVWRTPPGKAGTIEETAEE